MNIHPLKTWFFCLLISANIGSAVRASQDQSEKNKEFFKQFTQYKGILKMLKQIKITGTDRVNQSGIQKSIQLFSTIFDNIAACPTSALPQNAPLGKNNRILQFPGAETEYVTALQALQVIKSIPKAAHSQYQDFIKTFNEVLIKSLMSIDQSKINAKADEKTVRNLSSWLQDYSVFIGLKIDDLQNEVPAIGNQQDNISSLLKGHENIPIYNAIIIENSLTMQGALKQNKTGYSIVYVAIFCCLAYIIGTLSGSVYNEMQRYNEGTGRPVQDKNKRPKRNKKIKDDEKDDLDDLDDPED